MQRARPWVVAAPPAILTLVVTSIGVGHRIPWSDELATWHASRLGAEDFRRLIGNVDAVIAPYYLFMHGWIDVFGDSATALRAPSVIAMAVAAGAIALIGRRLVGDGTGLLAGVLFAVVPSISRYGQEARPYALAMMGVAVATLLLLRACEQPSRRRWALYALAIAGAGVMHVVTLTVLLAHGWIAYGDRRLRGWVLAAAAGVVCVLPLVYVGSTQDNVIQWITADGEAVRGLPRTLFGSGGVARVVVVLGLLGAVVRWRSDRRSTVLLLLWALVPPVFCYLTFSVLHVFLARYLLFTVPAWLLLVASLAPALARFRGQARIGLAGALVAVLVVIGLPGQQAARHDPISAEPDFRRAAQIVDERLRPGDALVFSAGARKPRLAFAYMRDHGMLGEYDDVLAGVPAARRGLFTTKECYEPATCLARADRIWLISSARPGEGILPGRSEKSRQILATDFVRRKIAERQWVTVYLLTRR